MNFPCQRPKLQSQGTVPVVCNLLAIKKRPTVHAYLVTFTPEIKRDLHPLFRKVASEALKGTAYAYDGISMLVTANKIEDLELKFVLGKEKEFILKIVYKNSSTDESMSVLMYETIIKHHQFNHFVEGKRSFNKTEVFELSGGIELHGGLSHCIKSTNYGLFLNLDACFNVFIQERNVVDLLSSLYSSQTRKGGLPDVNDQFWREASLLLKNCQVETRHTNFPKKFKISGILNQSASKVSFVKDDKDITVAEYFSSVYGPLKNPEYPVAIVKKQGKESFFPIEVLKVCENQKYTRKLDEIQTAEMIKYAAKPPVERFTFIRNRIKDLEMNDNPTLKDFLLQIDNNFLECKAKILPAPKAHFGENVQVQADLTKGQVSIQRVKFFSPVSINKLSVIALGRIDKNTLEEGIRSLSSFGKSYGMNIPTNYSFTTADSPDDYDRVLKRETPDLCIVILASKESNVYNTVKRLAEVNHGVITQCILLKNFRNLSKIAFAANILLKINVKIGGSNLYIPNKIINKPTMLIGADVSHPGIGDLESPSIVGIVTSYEKTLTKYTTHILTQERRTEIISDLSNVVKKSLINFNKNNKCDPESIIFFRDGVGDSQFYSVFESEYKAIKEACLSYKSEYRPEVNVIVVQKRHSLKFLMGSASSGLTGGLNDSLVEKIERLGLKGGYDQRRDDQRRGGYDNDRRSGYDDSQRRGGYEQRRGYDDQRRGGYDDSQRRGGYEQRRGDQRRSGGFESPKGNLSAGTVVEEIGHPSYYDFYMISHHALQGTARPIRYQVLVNESNFNNDDLQEFIHNMCYLYQRSNKAVAGVAPVRFAHLAALRAKAYSERTQDNGVVVRQPVENLTENLYYL